MNDKDIAKLVAKLTISLASKEDIREVKDDIKGVKGDVKGVQDDIRSVKDDIRGLKADVGRLEGKIDYLDQKTNTILKFAEAVDDTVTELNGRVKRIEAIPVIAHELKKPNKR